MKISIENINFSYAGWSMPNISVQFPSGSFSAIVGPSGSGKTTLLRLIAGLEKPAGGRILFGPSDVTGLEASGRNVGLVFQNDALFTHMNVLGNVSFGPQMKKEKAPDELARAALRTVHLEGFEKRRIDSLSGGEKKRVAIARALAFNPSVLLLDEPFSGLDANLKEKMKLLLRELREKSLTIIMVTHDLEDAFSVAQNLVVMNGGRIEQHGAPVEIFRKPRKGFVEQFVSDYVLADSSKLTGFGAKKIALLKKTSVRDS